MPPLHFCLQPRFLLMTIFLPIALAFSRRFGSTLPTFLQRGGAMFSSSSNSSRSSSTHRVFLAVGSNLGDRYHNIHTALQLLCQNQTRLVRTSFLHETAPMYVEDQPSFLNGAVELETDREPMDLLDDIKRIEVELGRNLTGLRNGPRPVDLDILLYERQDSRQPILLQDYPHLIVPHPRMAERDFVLRPLVEVAGADLRHPVLNRTIGELLQQLGSTGEPLAMRVLPLPRSRMLAMKETLVMGVLNVTPDSFSDGGLYQDSVALAVEQALAMEEQGADVIDIGGESTRPGAKEVEVATELERTIPIIQGIRHASKIPISIDTRHAKVARAAVEAGADIVNDVSGGTFDPDMLATVAELDVPMIIMHMRGTPETMQSMAEYDDVVAEVAEAIAARSKAAEEQGIHRWLQVIDPGIGFAKDLRGNLSLLRNVAAIRSATSNLPIMLGTSRKGFIGKLAQVNKPSDRDPGTIASWVAALCLDNTAAKGCNIIRVHNVAASKQAVRIVDAILRAN